MAFFQNTFSQSGLPIISANGVTSQGQLGGPSNDPNLIIAQEQQASLSEPSYKFPGNLDRTRTGHFMRFKSYQIQDFADTKLIGGKEQSITPQLSIYLPTPATINVDYNAAYDSLQRGMFSAAAGNQFGQGMFTGQFGTVSNFLKNFGTKVREGINAVGDFGSGENFQQADAAARGQAVRNYEVASFTGMMHRNLNYQFRLIAKNQDESLVIYNLVNQFKRGMHPGISADAAKLSYPFQWSIEFYDFDPENAAPARNAYMYQPGISYLININVMYNGSGIPAFFKDTNAPVEVDLNLQFMERDILVREQFPDPENGNTTGSIVVNSTNTSEVPAGQRLQSLAN